MPFLLVSLGVGGAWMGSLTVLAPYRWIFVTGAVAALGYAGYNEWQLSCRPDCDCESVYSPTTRRSLVGLATVAVAAIVVSPWLLAPSPKAAPGPQSAPHTAAPEASTPAPFRRVVLEVEDMTCAACPKTVKTALQDVNGVYSVEATFKPPEVVVRYDPEETSVEALTRATKSAGYPSYLQSAS